MPLPAGALPQVYVREIRESNKLTGSYESYGSYTSFGYSSRK